MAELDHINDIDNGVVYDLKDNTARQTITENRQFLRNLLCVYAGNVGGAEQVPGYGRYNVVDITLTSIVGAFNISAMDGAFLRIIFRDSSFYDYSLPILIKAFESDYSREVYCYVYTNTDKTEKLKITGTETIDFIYDKVQHCFFVVGRSSTGDLSNYYTKSQTDNLLNAKANAADLATVATSGNYNDLSNLPTIPAAQVPSDWNATAGVARILNKPNLSAVATSGNYSDLNGAPTLAPVATSGDYDDLTDKPDLSELQYLANVAAADDFNPGTSYSYLDFVKYNDHLYICISSSGSTAGPFDPTEWNEIIIGEQAAETARAYLLANQNENRLNNLATVATSGDYSDLNGIPTIPAAQVNSDWNATGTVAEILNKPNLSAVATSGNYSDLQGAPSLAAVATSGLYADLVGSPTLAPVATSGDYDDLSNKPTFKTINGDAITGTGNIETPYYSYKSGATFSGVVFNGLGGYITTGSTDLWFFVPFAMVEAVPDITKFSLELVLRTVDGGYPYLYNGSSWQWMNTYIPIITNGTKASGVSSVVVQNLNPGGFTIQVKFTNTLRVTNSGTTAIKNNVPIAVVARMSGTIA